MSSEQLQRAVEQLVAAQTGQSARVVSWRPVGGGCINDAQIVELDGGERLFVKSHDDPPFEMFEREAEGLAALAAAGVLRVPRPLGTGEASGRSFLVMEHVDSGRPAVGFSRSFGAALAELHRTTTAQRFGFSHDNYLGSTPQPNGWHDNWIEFWRKQRLGHQLTLARQRGRSDAELAALGEHLSATLDALLAEPDEPPCLLHGDLWGGNYLVDEEGQPVLIDPAAYYGRREADLAMTRLFGGFDSAFYEGYESVWPLAPGAERRLAVYELYHLLNHLNLFGRSYRARCIAIMRRLTEA